MNEVVRTHEQNVEVLTEKEISPRENGGERVTNNQRVDCLISKLINDFRYIFSEHEYTVVCFNIGEYRLEISKQGENRYTLKDYSIDHVGFYKGSHKIVYGELQAEQVIKSWVIWCSMKQRRTVISLGQRAYEIEQNK